MIICRLSGGLANQLFQYVFANSFKQNELDNLFFDISYFNSYAIKRDTFRRLLIDQFVDLNKVKLPIYFVLFCKFCVRFNIFLPYMSFVFNSFIIGKPKSKYIFIDGVSLDSKQIQLEFKQNLPLYSNLLSRKSNSSINHFSNFDIDNSCVIHIRRGDYLSSDIANNYHGVLGLEYYYKSIEIINSILPNIVFYVFSDDLLWSKSHFNFGNNIFIFPEENFNLSDIDSLNLMSQFKHHILANSSFSLWAAYISYFSFENSSIKIYPKNWWVKEEINLDLSSNWICV